MITSKSRVIKREEFDTFPGADSRHEVDNIGAPKIPPRIQDSGVAEEVRHSTSDGSFTILGWTGAIMLTFIVMSLLVM